jgi:hypothetical protein
MVVCASYPLFFPWVMKHISRQSFLQTQGAVPLAALPAWTLPDDNSGLDALLRSQVCMLPALLHENR